MLYELRAQAARAGDPRLGGRCWSIDDGDVEALDALAALHRDRRVVARAGRDLRAQAPDHSGRRGDRRALRLQSAPHLTTRSSRESNEAVEPAARAPRRERQATPRRWTRWIAIFTREERHAGPARGAGPAHGAARATAVARDELAFRAARLTEAELSDVEAAIARYQAILAAHAERTPSAREALWTIARGDDYRRAGRRGAGAVLRAARDVGRRSSSCSSCASRSRTRWRRAWRCWREIARIEETERRDTGQGLRGLGARAHRGGDRGRRRARRSSGWRPRRGDWMRSGRGLRRAHGGDVRRRRCSARSRCGSPTLHEDQLADLPRAADFLRKALSLPGDEAAGAGVAGVACCASSRPGTELAEILSREAEVANDPGEQADFLAALGEVAAAALDDADGALAAFRDALEREPGAHAGARARCTTLLDRRGDARGRAGRSWSRSPTRAATTSELLALYEQRLEPARRSRASARTGCARSRRSSTDQLGRPAAGAGGAGTRAEGRADAGRGARRSRADRRRGQDSARRRRAKIEAALERRRAGRGSASWRCGRRASTSERRRAARRPSACTSACSRAIPRTSTRCRRSRGCYRGRRATRRAWRRSWSGARRSSWIRRRASSRLLEAARPARAPRRGRHRRRHRGAADAARGRRGRRRGARRAGAAATRRRARSRSWPTCWPSARASPRMPPSPRRAVGARRRAAPRACSTICDGAAEAYREALEGAPDDPIVAVGAGGDRGAREDWSTLQEVLMRRFGATFGADQIAVLLKLARNAEQKLSDADQAIGFLRQILDADAGNALRVPGAGAAAAHERALVRPGRGARPSTRTPRGRRGASRPSWRCASRSPTSGRRSSTRPTAPRRRWRRCWRWRPTNVGALLSLARLHEGAERWDEAGEALERGGRERGGAGARSPRSSSATRRSCIAQGGGRGRDRARRCCGRWTPTRPTGRRWRRWRRWRARRRTTSGWCSSWSCALETATDDDERKRAARGDRRRSTPGRSATRRRRCRYLERLVALDPEGDPGARAAGRRAGRRGPHRRRGPLMRELVAELTQGPPGQGRGALAHAARHAGRGARRLEGRGRRASAPPTSWTRATPATRRGARPARVPRRRSRARAQVLPLAAAAELRREDAPASRRPRST